MKKIFLLGSVVWGLWTSPQAFSCSVCFGNPNSLQSKALGASVFFLLATVGIVLGGILFYALKWTWRAKKLQKTPFP